MAYVSLELQQHLSALSALHHVESLLEIIEFEAVGDDRGKVETGNEHLLHLVPGLPHFTSVYSLESQSIENHLTPRDLSIVRLYSKE